MELPSAAQPDHWVPFAVVWPMASAERARACQRELVAQGFGVALLASNKPRQPLKATMFALRQAHRIDQGAAHAVIGGDRASIDELLAHRHEFQTVTVLGEVADADLEALRRLRTRRVHALADADAAAVAAHVATLHRGRALKGPAAEVALTLDAFHHAAAVGDEARYFEIFPDDAVFLGTDPRERWSGKQFKQFAMRYFERPSRTA
ncbi:MAG: nuclear transport factor 2 family protein [Planctomycetes bacterium]|nr:nuclear transport factor 2 family protein [Planctomycetota bacterium]